MNKVVFIASLLFATLIGHLAVGQAGSPLYRSTDNGKTWHPWNQGLTQALRVDRIMEQAEKIFVLTEGQGLFVSLDEGKHWTKPGFSMLLPQKGDVIHAHKNLLWLGTYKKGVLVSADQGNSWVPCNQGLQDLTIRAFHSREEHLWVGTNEGVYRWDIATKKWEAQLEGIQVNDFAQMGKHLFVATHKGMQVSGDRGLNWKETGVKGTITQLYDWNAQLYACSMHRKVWKYSSARETWEDDTTFFPPQGLSTTILYGDEKVIYVTQKQQLYRKFTGQTQWEPVSNGLSKALFFRDLKMVQPGVFLLACAAKP